MSYVREMIVTYSTKRRDVPPRMSGPSDIADYARSIIGSSPVEKVIAIYLDAKNKVLCWKLISSGTLDRSSIHPRDIFSGALECYAASVVIAHNHPSGETVLSSDDVLISERLKKAGALLGIPVLDHVVVSDETTHYGSAREMGVV